MDKRRHRRDFTTTIAEYSFTHQHHGDVFDGIIVNISESGLCLLTTTFLSQGQEIIIRNGALVASRKANVRWAERYRDAYYRAGLEFSR
ncbi:MAG: PilZ domain-containing protein [Nitrospirota bacterium]